VPRLRTGNVIVGYYATKIRRTLYAQNKELIRTGQLDAKEIARAAGELNQKLYTLFVERLVLSKGDIARVEIDYDVMDGAIVWNYDSLSVSVYRRLDPDSVAAALRSVLQERLQVQANG